MLKRDPKDKHIVSLKDIESKAVLKMLVDGYQLDTLSLSIDATVGQLGMSASEVVRAHHALIDLFSPTNSVPTPELKFLVNQGLTTGAGFIVLATGKQVVYGFTKKGEMFFNLMYRPMKAPRVLSKRNVDGYALIKYDDLANCLKL